jgi:hypothetical protein
VLASNAAIINNQELILKTLLAGQRRSTCTTMLSLKVLLNSLWLRGVAGEATQTMEQTYGTLKIDFVTSCNIMVGSWLRDGNVSSFATSCFA